MTVMTQRDDNRLRRAGVRGAPSKDSTTWIQDVFGDLSVVSACSLACSPALAPGLAALVEVEDDGQALVLRGGKGAALEDLARAFHRRDAEGSAVFVVVDGRSRRSLAQAGELARRFRAHALETTHEESRRALVGTTIFVDAAESLSQELIDDFVQLADMRREGRPCPRLIFATENLPEGDLSSFSMLEVAPLVTRADDVLATIVAAIEDRVDAPQLESEAVQVLREHAWSGGEKELARFIEALVERHAGHRVGAAQVTELLDPRADAPTDETSLAELEERQIYRVLEANDWNRTRSSQVLGIDVKTLYNKLKRYESRRRRLERGRTTA
ncbi:MAG: hypothetical protein H6807_04775 [Planctomycetes bacterium]|nr:hypothetical protein [Planctomycetota bacterium]